MKEKQKENLHNTHPDQPHDPLPQEQEEELDPRLAKIKSILKTLPNKPGVYLMRDEKGDVIYVGKAKSLKKRVSSYFRKRDFASPRLRKLTQLVTDISTIRTETEADALIVEARLIKKLQPFFNVELKMGIRYPSVVITDEKFPKVTVTRLTNPPGQAFGPYTQSGILRDILRLIEDHFPLRICNYDLSKTKLPRPCIMYDLGKCVAPCVGNVTERQYGQYVDDVIMLLSGNNSDLMAKLRDRMDRQARQMDFEGAARTRDTIRALWKFTRTRISATLSSNLDEDAWSALTHLQEVCNLPTVPWRIDGFDISHSSGHETYGVAVVFEQGYPNPSLYRRFLIKTVEGIDDFRSMRETVLRRYRYQIDHELPLPQLILIDGGPEQLAFARQALKEVPIDIPTIALAKREELIFTDPHLPPIDLPSNDPALRLLQRIRDESHRYAITTHRKKRISRLSRSALEDIPGIGKHKAAQLLMAFGSVQRIAGLSLEELQKVDGIGEKQAKNVLDHLEKFLDLP